MSNRRIKAFTPTLGTGVWQPPVPTPNTAPSLALTAPSSVEIGAGQVLIFATSTDPEGDPITYSWSLTSRPGGSTAALAGSTATQRGLTPDVAGNYVVQVTVNDDGGAGRGVTNPVPLSVVSQVTITAVATPVTGNAAPVARLTGPITGTTAVQQTYDAITSSDPDGDPITFSFTLVSKPGGSTAVLVAGTASSNKKLTPDVAGDYQVQVTVTDDGGAARGVASPVSLNSTATVTITATAPASAVNFNNTLGVYRSSQTESSIQTYEGANGINRTLPGFIVTFAGNVTTWSALNSSVSSLCSQFSNRINTLGHSKLCISLVPYPDKATAGAFTMQAAAAGSYNSQYAAIATIIKNAGYSAANVVIRLGWEFNGNYFLWSILGTKDTTSTPARFASMFQNAVTSMRAVMPGLQFDWCIKGGGDSTQAQVDAAFPGASYLTSIGVDVYDFSGLYASSGRNTTTQNSAFDFYTSQTCGLQYAKTKAIANSLKCSFFEWGNLHDPRTANTPYGGDDNPVFPSRMGQWCDTLGAAGLLLGHSYFEHDAADGDHQIHTLGGTAPLFPMPNTKSQYDALLRG